jgi:hypothetical protein
VERDKPKIGIGWTNFAAVAMETKKGGLNFFFIPFINIHENYFLLCSHTILHSYH